MSDPRLERDLEDIFQRLRSLESLSAPGIAQLMSDFRELRAKVEEMDVSGTHVTQERFKRLEDRETDIRQDISEMKEDQRATRNIVKSALITAALAIGVNIVVGMILFVVLR